MKRQIKELRRALLAVEAGQTLFDKIADPVGAYHVYLLYDGGFIAHLIADPGINHDNYIVGVPGLTRAGCDLLDQLRDEGRVDKAQAWLESEGFDRDYLAPCLAWLDRDMRKAHETKAFRASDLDITVDYIARQDLPDDDRGC